MKLLVPFKRACCHQKIWWTMFGQHVNLRGASSPFWGTSRKGMRERRAKRDAKTSYALWDSTWRKWWTRVEREKGRELDFDVKTLKISSSFLNIYFTNIVSPVITTARIQRFKQPSLLLFILNRISLSKKQLTKRVMPHWWKVAKMMLWIPRCEWWYWWNNSRSGRKSSVNDVFIIITFEMSEHYAIILMPCIQQSSTPAHESVLSVHILRHAWLYGSVEIRDF